MSTTQIPELKRKFELLRTYGPWRTWAALAKAFDRQTATIRWWAHGDGGRAPGSLPHEHVLTFLELVRQVLPDTLSEPESRAIAFGDALTFELVLQGRPARCAQSSALC